MFLFLAIEVGYKIKYWRKEHCIVQMKKYCNEEMLFHLLRILKLYLLKHCHCCKCSINHSLFTVVQLKLKILIDVIASAIITILYLCLSALFLPSIVVKVCTNVSESVRSRPLCWFWIQPDLDPTLYCSSIKSSC